MQPSLRCMGSMPQSQPTNAHIRPFNAQTDLAELADLIEVAFGDELARTGNRMVEDLRQWASWGRWLNLATVRWPLYSGLVWVEEQRIIGNVSYSRDRGRGEWQLSNVAVYPEYRGRGIAGQLCDAALDQIRAAGGQRVYLQVRSDNLVAHTLYEHRGFARYDTVRELGLAPERRPMVIGQDRALRPLPWWSNRQVLELARVALPPERLAARPYLLAEYRRSLWWQLMQLALPDPARSEYQYAAFSGRRLLAWGHVRAEAARQPAEIELLVRPECRGAWESRLIGALLAGYPFGRTPLRAHVSLAHPEASEALAQYGFQTLRVLDEMVLCLRG